MSQLNSETDWSGRILIHWKQLWWEVFKTNLQDIRLEMSVIQLIQQVLIWLNISFKVYIPCLHPDSYYTDCFFLTCSLSGTQSDEVWTCAEKNISAIHWQKKWKINSNNKTLKEKKKNNLHRSFRGLQQTAKWGVTVISPALIPPVPTSSSEPAEVGGH